MVVFLQNFKIPLSTHSRSWNLQGFVGKDPEPRSGLLNKAFFSTPLLLTFDLPPPEQQAALQPHYFSETHPLADRFGSLPESYLSASS